MFPPLIAAVTQQSERMGFVAYVSVLKDLATIAGASVAMYVAIRGLSTWRRQLRGNVAYELARRYLKATFRVRDSLNSIRGSLMISPGEIHRAMKEAGYSDEQMAAEKDSDKQTGLVYDMWWKRVVESMTALEIEEVEAEVIWGQEYREIVKPLGKRAQELGIAIHMWFSLRARPGRRADYADQIEQYERVLWKMSEEPDEFDRKLGEAVKNIESRLKPHLKN